MKTKSKEIYPKLIQIKWSHPHDFLYDAVINPTNIMWGSGGAGREFAREILSKDANWHWLSYRIDDFAPLIERDMRNKLNVWIWRANLNLGALSKQLHSTETVVIWLMDRYVAMLKNLFDTRYKNSLKPSFLIEFDENTYI